MVIGKSLIFRSSKVPVFFQILDMMNKVALYKPQALQKKNTNRFTVSLDSDSNTIQQRDIVKVNFGCQFCFVCIL